MQMASRVTFWLFQWRAMGSTWSDRSRLMKPGNMVWVLSTAVGTMAHSTAMAEITGSATVSEHCPTQEMSCTVKILLYDMFRSPFSILFPSAGNAKKHPELSGAKRSRDAVPIIEHEKSPRNNKIAWRTLLFLDG